MKVTIEPTPEIVQIEINGVEVPLRIYRGLSEGGVPMDVYVLSIVADDGYHEQLKAEVPSYMQPTSDSMSIGVPPSEH